eukprot:CAMPEP_0202442088 /NCGR_PEP_ID=MMETSP1360-20130828/1565_1 /ASSEMBLY_ACC=CAM_ASM_000848 /TAXON_ID=515479 /ORGANISM="Licmophora paradoxa, Strain CCMP2313" /LENGTH=78 /DNA_ID=CAMNT_0049057341 /DNA_START=33 /DNA_END=266 /DNA_ORIENTATION=+
MAPPTLPPRSILMNPTVTQLTGLTSRPTTKRTQQTHASQQTITDGSTEESIRTTTNNDMSSVSTDSDNTDNVNFNTAA